MNRIAYNLARYAFTGLVAYVIAVSATNYFNKTECGFCKRKLDKKQKCRTKGCKNYYGWNNKIPLKPDDYVFVEDLDDVGGE